MLKTIFYVIITALCFATLEPVSKTLAGAIDAYSITAIRFIIGGLCLLPLAIPELRRNKLKPKDLLTIGVIGVAFICISMILLQKAIEVAENPSLVAIIFSANSIITIAFSAIFLGNRVTKIQIVGILLSLVGVVIASNITSGGDMLSIVLAILSALTFSIYTIVSKKYTAKMNVFVQTSLSFIIGGGVLLVALCLLGVNPLAGVSSSNLPTLIYISIVVTGIGYIGYFMAMKHGGVQMAATAYFIKPVLTPFAAWVVLGIIPDTTIFAALIFVVAGVILASGRVKCPARKAQLNVA